ncbi:MAG: COX15/CtaA family protein [Alphaproteobacteria bacterium]|nr:COX15/CtaA family protein [Alphaproteobacteria bacterium]
MDQRNLSLSHVEARPQTARRAVVIWLGVVFGLVFLMIMVGGLTRLTDSGLSIVEWRPVTGAIPPLSDEAWREEFAKYQTIPEYQIQNRGMTLGEFKFIYWWEWSHRFLGRLIGAVFLVPFVIFWWRGMIARALGLRLSLLFLLGGAQGALGWWMVMSGLTERLDVSQYRLAAHLGLAFLILGLIVWTILDLLRGEGVARALKESRLAPFALLFAGLVYVQILLGAFVAGTDAGLTYNTWPLMDGRFIPEGLLTMKPWYVNFFEDVTTIQFQHRMTAYLVGLSAIGLFTALWRAGPSRRTMIAASHVLGASLLQIALGIWVLLAQAPLSLSALHQAMAVVLFTAALWLAHELRQPLQLAASPQSRSA